MAHIAICTIARAKYRSLQLIYYINSFAKIHYKICNVFLGKFLLFKCPALFNKWTIRC